jgi:large subunit ribosomal protein L24
MKLKAGDKVKITAGKDRGRTGVIEKVFPKEARVLVPGVNLYKKHRKGFGGQKGGIIEFARPLPVANVALICPSCGKQTRVSYRMKAGTKVRICAKCKKPIDVLEKEEKR